MPTKPKRKPSYTLHKPTGRARVRIDGKDHYLGEYGSQESKDRYDELIEEWLIEHDVSGITITLDELSLLYLNHAKSYYVKDGKQTTEVKNIRLALRRLIAFAGRTRVRDFGARQFRQFRDSMVGMKDTRVKNSDEARMLSRQHINKTMRYIVRCFKWGAAEEHVPTTVWQALTAVPGLKKGRTEAREAKRVQPVSDADVDATIPHLSPSVAAMVNLQRLTGMRPGEVVEMRPCDVTRRTDGIWCYRPSRFKTEHHEDSERIVLMGPKAQAILKQWLERDAEAPCFSPVETVA